MKTILNFIPAVLVLFVSGCANSDYRMRSTINTDKPYGLPWKEQPAWHDPSRFWDRDATTASINPYTFNPANPLNYTKGAVYGYNMDSSGMWVANFQNWLAACSNALAVLSFATNTNCAVLTNVLSAQYEKQAQLLEVYAPLYWKASLSSNITGLDDKYRKYCRNELQNAIFRVVKESTAQHLTALKGADSRVNLFLGASAIGLASGATVAGAAAAKALAAASAGAGGARALFNEQIYRNTFVEAIIALVQKDQADFAELVRTNYQTNAIEDYTVEAAINDAKEYENKGSFYNGLALLQKAVQSQINSGVKSIVPFNQLGTVEPQIHLPDSLVIHLGTNTTQTVTTNFVLLGRGLSHVDTLRLRGSANALVKVDDAFASSPFELKLTLTTTRTNLPITNAPLLLPLDNHGGNLTIKIETAN